MNDCAFTEERRTLHFLGEQQVRVYVNATLSGCRVVVPEKLVESLTSGGTPVGDPEPYPTTPEDVLRSVADLPACGLIEEIVLLPLDMRKEETSLPPPLLPELVGQSSRMDRTIYLHGAAKDLRVVQLSLMAEWARLVAYDDLANTRAFAIALDLEQDTLFAEHAAKNVEDIFAIKLAFGLLSGDQTKIDSLSLGAPLQSCALVNTLQCIAEKYQGSETSKHEVSEICRRILQLTLPLSKQILAKHLAGPAALRRLAVRCAFYLLPDAELVGGLKEVDLDGEFLSDDHWKH